MTLGILVTLAQPKVAVRDAMAANEAGIPVVVDSGAWSVLNGTSSMTVESHAEFVAKFPVRDVRFVALDVIGDAEASWRNWRMERERDLPVEPTLHYGLDPKLLDRYVDFGLATEWVNLGGLVSHQKAATRTTQVAAWCAAVMTRHRNLRFHGLGCITPRLNRLVSFGAVDSTYWLSFGRYRSLPLFDARTGDWIVLPVPRRGRMREVMDRSWRTARNVAPMLADIYSLSLTDLCTADDDVLASKAIQSQAGFARYFGDWHGNGLVCYLAGAGTKHLPMIEEAS